MRDCLCRALRVGWVVVEMEELMGWCRVLTAWRMSQRCLVYNRWIDI